MEMEFDCLQDEVEAGRSGLWVAEEALPESDRREHKAEERTDGVEFWDAVVLGASRGDEVKNMLLV